MDDFNEEVFLSLGKVFSYLQATPESRCVVEGEALVNAKHIILLGTTSATMELVQIIALCLQTSGVKNSPHEINGKLIHKDGDVNIVEFTCTCKAGLSGICKHIAAVLIKCTRCNIYSLEKLSSTDVKCYWARKKKAVEEEYEARRLLETSCYKPLVTRKRPLIPEENEMCFKLLTSVCPESSLSVHLQGRLITSTSNNISVTSNLEIPTYLTNLLDCAARSEFLPQLNIKLDEFELRDCCTNLLGSISDINITDVAVSSIQRSDIWYQERQYRITGSRCYSLYTYSKDNWDVKAKNYFWPKKFSNRYVLHGLKYEKEALKKYQTVNNYDIYEPGLIVCGQYPWLAYSPDGVVFADGFPNKLIEIKCPYDGIDNDAVNFVHTCNYLQLSTEEGLRLKQHHAYYGQVQMGMAILNLKT